MIEKEFLMEWYIYSLWVLSMQKKKKFECLIMNKKDETPVNASGFHIFKNSIYGLYMYQY